MNAPILPRRVVLKGGALAVWFSLGCAARAHAQAAPRLPGDLTVAPLLDAWIRIDADGRVTVFTGKAELGQGIRTALLQVAAEQLDLDPARITLITADTDRTPDEGYTAGSHSMPDSGTAILNAAAEVRMLLVQEAAARWGVPPERLATGDGSVRTPGGRSLDYGTLAAGIALHRAAEPPFSLKPPGAYRVMGNSLPRVDIPGKVTGAESYVHDLRLPGMVHARVVRPFAYGGKLLSADIDAAERLPGVLKVVRDGSFLGAIAEREHQAIVAMRALSASAKWEPGRKLPEQAHIAEVLQQLPAQDLVILDRSGTAAAPVRTLEASYSRPYLAHASIGPSCAVALFQPGQLTVWTHSQGVYPLRRAIAAMLRMPETQVRCIHREGAGCYGQNGADDAAADAALLARAFPERPVRLQWMREQEQEWEPYGPAMVTRVRGGLDASGQIVDWQYDVWSNTHATRPGPPGVLLAAQAMAEPFAAPRPRPLPMPEGGGDRNAIPLYRIPGARVVHHFIEDMPLRVSALRSLGAHMNVFSIESFMDELAAAAGADPVAFRLAHLDDPRAQDVVRTAAERFGWSGTRPGTGRGFAFARYKNLAAYVALALDVRVEHESGRIRIRRVVAAVDSGQAVNPDGIRNQIEGGIVQSASWTLYEQVAFDRERVISRDWRSYPILRFDSVPDGVEVHVIDRPGAPFLGTGEAAQGPTAAALANAVADATGISLRKLPLRLPG